MNSNEIKITIYIVRYIFILCIIRNQKIKRKNTIKTKYFSFFTVLTIPQNCLKFKTVILYNSVVYRIRGVENGRKLFRYSK